MSEENSPSTSPKAFVAALEQLIDEAIKQGHDAETVVTILHEQGHTENEHITALIHHLYNSKLTQSTSN